MSYGVDLKELVQAGLHFGHQRYRWSPLMKPYIWGHRNGIHLIDISKTAQALEKAARFLETAAAENKQILWVGTKKVAAKAISETAQGLNMPYVDYRWVGGMLTNFSQVKKSVTKLMHFEDVLAKSADSHHTKKELNVVQKATDRLCKSVGGIKKLHWPVGAVVIIDTRKEATALREAVQCGVPVIALVATNCDPSMVDIVIPGNDDSAKSVGLVLRILGAAAQRGKEQALQNKAAAKPVVVAEPTGTEAAPKVAVAAIKTIKNAVKVTATKSKRSAKDGEAEESDDAE